MANSESKEQIMGKVVNIRPAYEIGSDSPYPVAMITHAEIDNAGKTVARWSFRELPKGTELKVGQIVQIKKSRPNAT